jgi:alkaline phosphatase
MNAAVAAGAKKILGLFTPGGKTRETYRVDPASTYPDDEPTLPEMVSAALEAVGDDRKGVFFVIEGSQIDWAGHANDINYLLGEMLAFDESMEVLLGWINAKRKRKVKSNVTVVGDHETGGFMLNGPYGSLSMAGDIIDAGWTSGGHTAQDTIIWSMGPGSRDMGRALDNTDLYYILEEALNRHGERDDD